MRGCDETGCVTTCGHRAPRPGEFALAGSPSPPVAPEEAGGVVEACHAARLRGVRAEVAQLHHARGRQRPPLAVAQRRHQLGAGGYEAAHIPRVHVEISHHGERQRVRLLRGWLLHSRLGGGAPGGAARGGARVEGGAPPGRGAASGGACAAGRSSGWRAARRSSRRRGAWQLRVHVVACGEERALALCVSNVSRRGGLQLRRRAARSVQLYYTAVSP